MRHLRTTIRSTIVAGVVSAAFASSAVAAPLLGGAYVEDPKPSATQPAPADLRSPDAADTSKTAAVDLRSPDATVPVKPVPTAADLRSPDATVPVKPVPTAVDLRSPDAKVPVSFPTAKPAASPVSIPAPDSGGFDIVSALIGLGVGLIGLGAMAAGRRRRATGGVAAA